MNQPFTDVIQTEEELRTLLGFPSKTVQNKTISYLDHNCMEFISKSPFLMLSTADAEGNCDTSPRGDAPGFVHVLDQKHLVIPERPGNRRMDSLRNILSNKRVGLLFLIPGLEETLRINGEAWVVRDEEILHKMQAFGKDPLLGIVVKVEECFVHCAKAFKRSHLWQPDSWLSKETLPNMPKMLAEHVNLPDVDEESMVELLEESYTKRLY
ncbi:pyridoxamine 5'-phosphate oxidase family protein [Cytobacillus sp. FJAT-54145]|uniref:Pyridoxamine 5'-phosphate oxidase family protein n=1 Tax=Cytobacillus spartinae TaxID=3299023 RepID=A0ABW6KFC4_9BACI